MKTKFKKAVAVLSICLLAGLSFIPVTASAHCGHHSTTRYSVCKVKSCHKSGVHKHHGKTYCGGHSSRCYNHRHC